MDRYNTPPKNKDQIEAMSKENVLRMINTDPIRAKYFNKLRKSGQLQIGGRRTNKNKKKHKKLSRRSSNKKNRKSMKRK